MKNKTKPNIRLIAEKAGVSTATVSRAINFPDKVQPETRRKVFEVIEAFQYTPASASASSSELIAFFTYDTNNAFYNEVLYQFSSLASKAGYYVLTCNTYGIKETEEKLFEYFKKAGCAGIVLTGLTRLTNIHAKTPVILLDSSSSVTGEYYNISSDNKTAITILTDYLVALGHRKIGFISGGSHTSAGLVRQKLFTDYMNKLSLDVPDIHIFSGDFTVASGYQAFDYFFALQDRPTAILSSNDEMAKGFISRANALGVRIPQDMSICGIDAIPNDHFQPRITSIRQDTAKTAEELLKVILSREQFRTGSIVLPVTFVPGDTCYRLNE